MKVYYLLDSLGGGGAERSLLAMVPRFRAVEPVVGHLFPDDELAPEYRQAGARVDHLGASGKRQLPGATVRLVRRLRRERPDLLQITGFFAAFAGRLAGRVAGVPIVETFTNESYTAAHFAATPPGSRWKLAVARRLDRWTLPWASRVIAVSDAVRRSNCATLGFPLAGVEVIHRGRDPEAYRSPEPELLVELGRSLGLPAGGTVLVCVSRLIPRKGHEDALRAVPLLRQRLDRPLTLLLVGDGHHRPALEALAGELGITEAVRFLGHRPDVPHLLHLADLFLFCSRFEGHPGALVEAMLAARPILATDVPVHRETLGETAGRLYPAGDPEALARHAFALLADRPQAAELGRSARRTAEARFTVDRIASEYERLYAEIVAAGTGAS